MELTGNVQGLIDLVGGGSDVEFDQVLESGEKIGIITIDNVPTDIYAPEGTEVKVTQALSSGTKIATIEVDGESSDIYAPEGTEVDVTQVLSSGTKIATIEVDGEGVDLYAPTPEGPTSVEVTQVLSSGTKIATIEVDGVDTDLYAPEGGGGDIERSSTEKKIGTGYNGKPIYHRTFNIPISLTDGSNDIWSYYTGLYNVKVVLMNYKNGNSPAVERCNNSVPAKGGVYITYQTNNGALRIGIDTGFTVSALEFTLEYQKTSD